MKRFEPTFSYYRGCRAFMFLVAVFLLMSALSPCAVKVTSGRESALKLSEHISEYFRSEIDLFKSPGGPYSEKTVPRLLLSPSRNPAFFFYDGSQFTRFDCLGRKLGNTFASPGKNIWNILPSLAADKIYLSGDELSRVDLASGKIDWTKELGLTSVIYLGGMVSYSLPILYGELPGRKQLAVVGLQKGAKGNQYLNKITFYNAENGEVMSDQKFHYRRKISGSTELFINTDSWEFEIVDLDTMEIKVKGKLDPLDLLQSYDHIAIDIQRMDIDLPISKKEINAHFLGSGFMITSRELYMTGAVETSKWVIFDEKGKKVKTISPAPLTSFDYAVNNLGGSEWPVYMLHTYYRKLRRPRVDKIIALDKDGSFTEFELPAIEGIDEFMLNPVQNWFHEGETFYYTRDGNIFRFKLREKDGERVYAAVKADACETVEAWDAKYVMLRTLDEDLHPKAVLIRFADGKKIGPEEFSEQLDTNLWKVVVDFNQSSLPLPGAEAFPGLKAYSRYYSVLDLKGKKKKANRAKFGMSVQMFKVWGDYTRVGKYGDIGIVPATMDDKSAALIGINIADNQPLFSVPVLKFSGLDAPGYANIFPGGFYLPFNIIQLNETEALLVVLEKIDLLKIYKLIRP